MSESESIGPEDVAEVNAADLLPSGEDREQVFAGQRELDGMEPLGRAIVDKQGVPSGSPANFENLRGLSSETVITEEDKARIMANLKTEFGFADQPSE